MLYAIKPVLEKIVCLWDITPCGPLKATDVPEEHVASIFRVEE
jgi:hypothetical protein